jgi:polar amino acid transport system substrate-binding protein
MRSRPKLATILAIFLCASMTLFAATTMAQEKSRLQTVLERGRLIVATFSTAPPFCYTDEKGQLVGFDIDVARLLATALFRDPTKVEFVVVTAEGRWPAVESGRADMGIATTTIYPDRAIRVAFTRPYVDTGVAVLVRKDSNIKSLSDFNQDKFTIADLNNPQQADRAKRFIPKAKVGTYDTPAAQVLAVRSGRANGAQLDIPVADWYAGNNKDEFDGVFAEQRHLRQTRRLRLVALARYRGGRNAQRIVLWRVLGHLSEMVWQEAAAAKVLYPVAMEEIRGGPISIGS